MAIVSEPTVSLEVASRANGAEVFFEIIDGQRVEMPPMNAMAVVIANRIVRKVGEFADARDLGEAVVEVHFKLPLPEDRHRRADGAFVSYQRWPKGTSMGRENAWNVAPNLAIEVVSPNDLIEELMDKIDEYFRAGVELVWVVYPRHRLVHVYESWSSVRVLGPADSLEGGPVLPGFRLPLASIFLESVG